MVEVRALSASRFYLQPPADTVIIPPRPKVVEIGVRIKLLGGEVNSGWVAGFDGSEGFLIVGVGEGSRVIGFGDDVAEEVVVIPSVLGSNAGVAGA